MEERCGGALRRSTAYCLLPAPHGFLSLFLIQLWIAYLPRGGATHSGPGPPTSVINQMMPRTGPRTNLMEATPELRFPAQSVRQCQIN